MPNLSLEYAIKMVLVPRKDVKESLTWFMRCGNMTPIANLIDKQQYEIETLKARVVELEITVPIEGGPLYQEAMKRFNELKEFYV